jgi:hypothetical protein
VNATTAGLRPAELSALRPPYLFGPKQKVYYVIPSVWCRTYLIRVMYDRSLIYHVS